MLDFRTRPAYGPGSGIILTEVYEGLHDAALRHNSKVPTPPAREIEVFG